MLNFNSDMMLVRVVITVTVIGMLVDRETLKEPLLTETSRPDSQARKIVGWLTPNGLMLMEEVRSPVEVPTLPTKYNQQLLDPPLRTLKS